MLHLPFAMCEESAIPLSPPATWPHPFPTTTFPHIASPLHQHEIRPLIKTRRFSHPMVHVLLTSAPEQHHATPPLTRQRRVIAMMERSAHPRLIDTTLILCILCILRLLSQRMNSCLAPRSESALTHNEKAHPLQNLGLAKRWSPCGSDSCP